MRNQRQIFYSAKPFPFEQTQINHPSYLLPNFCHGPYSTDPSNSSLAVISQPYYKPPDVQAVCLVQDRQFISQQQTHQYNPYYNLSSTLQTVTNTNLQLPGQMPFSQFPNNFPNQSKNSTFHPADHNVDHGKKNKVKFIAPKIEEIGKTSEFYDAHSKIQELSDDSSFDYTIEAEKMVSALCNTSSNDLEKYENKSILNGAGDISVNKKNPIEGTSIGVQTQDDTKYSELIKKLTLWGCGEAENILYSGKCHRTSKLEWLMNLSMATRTAITKSSTCFSIFAGDRILIQDLINSLLRISNGWLILDNYLNKQPGLIDKYDRNLIKSFQIWEAATHELLQNVVNTFIILEKNTEHEEIETSGTPGTFPGDISIYTTCDLLEPPVKFNLAPGSAISSHNFQYSDQKETKAKGKWTIAENITEINSKTKKPSLNAEFFHLKNKILEDNRNKRQSDRFYNENFQDFSSDVDLKCSKTREKEMKMNFNVPSVFESKESVPMKKMTLLSQIEPNVSSSRKDEMTANLSAWFASMRNSIDEKSGTLKSQEITRDKMDLTRQLQLDANRQLLSLQNMQSIQSAPWNAANLINNQQSRKTRDEYDSSEDVRIYMKPGSYNVPKKRHQKRCNRKGDNSRNRHSNKSDPSFSIPKIDSNLGSKINFPGPFFKNSDNLMNNPSEDVTWKAACASAEFFLEVMNFNKNQQNQVTQNEERKINFETDLIFRDHSESKMFWNKNDWMPRNWRLDEYDQSFDNDHALNNRSFEDDQRNYDRTFEDEKILKNDPIYGNDWTLRNNQTFSDNQILKNNQTFLDDQMLKNDQTFPDDQLLKYNQTFLDDQMLRNNQTPEDDQMLKNNQTYENEQMLKNDQMLKNNQIYENDPILENNQTCENDQMLRNKDQTFVDKILENNDQMLSSLKKNEILRKSDQILRNNDQVLKARDQTLRKNEIFRNNDQIFQRSDPFRKSDLFKDDETFGYRNKVKKTEDVEPDKNLNQMIKNRNVFKDLDQMIGQTNKQAGNRKQTYNPNSVIKNHDQIDKHDLALGNHEQIINEQEMIKDQIMNYYSRRRNDQIIKKQDTLGKQNYDHHDQTIKNETFSDQDQNKDEMVRNQRITKMRNQKQLFNYQDQWRDGHFVRSQDPRIGKEHIHDHNYQMRNQDQNQMQDQVQNWMQNHMQRQTQSQMKDQMENQMKDHIQNQIKNQMQNQMKNQMQNPMKNQVQNQMKDQMHHRIKDKMQREMRDQMQNQMKNQVRNEMRDQVENQMRDQMQNERRDQVQNQLKDQMQHQMKNHMQIQMKDHMQNQIKDLMKDRMKYQTNDQESYQMKDEMNNKMKQIQKNQNPRKNQMMKHRDEMKDRMSRSQDQIQNQMENQMKDQMQQQMQNQMMDQRQHQMQNQIMDQRRHQMQSQMKDQVQQQMRNQMKDQLQNQMQNQMKNQIKNQTMKVFMMKDQKIKDEMMKNQKIKDQMMEDQKIKDQMMKDQNIKDQMIENQMLKDQIMEDQIMKEQMTKDQMMNQMMKDQMIKGHMLKDQMIKDQMLEDQMIRGQNQVIRIQNQKQRRSKSKKQKDEKNCDASSYEASEDDSEPSAKASRALKRLNETKSGKTNVKTDSWLIRTLNNVSKGKIEDQDNDLASSDSLNSSIEQIEGINETIGKSSNKDLFPSFSKISVIPGEITGKATYSETVRRSTSNSGKVKNEAGSISPFAGKKINRNDEKLYFGQKSRKATGKRFLKDVENEVQIEDNVKSKFFKEEGRVKSTLGRGRRKDNNLVLDGKYKSDRGWSVWYSSRRKQILSPLAVRKLETIYQTISKMDEAYLFKYPSSTEVSQQKMVDFHLFIFLIVN